MVAQPHFKEMGKISALVGGQRHETEGRVEFSRMNAGQTLQAYSVANLASKPDQKMITLGRADSGLRYISFYMVVRSYW